MNPTSWRVLGTLLLTGILACSNPPKYDGKTLGQWLELSEIDNTKVRLAAIEALGHFNPNEEILKAMVVQIHYPDARVNAAACEHLLSSGGDAVGTILASNEFGSRNFPNTYDRRGVAISPSSYEVCTPITLILSMGSAAESTLVEAYHDLERVPDLTNDAKRERYWRRRRRVAFLLTEIAPERAEQLGAKGWLVSLVLSEMMRARAYKDSTALAAMEDYRADLILRGTSEKDAYDLSVAKYNELLRASFYRDLTKNATTEEEAESWIWGSVRSRVLDRASMDLLERAGSSLQQSAQ